MLARVWRAISAAAAAARVIAGRIMWWAHSSGLSEKSA